MSIASGPSETAETGESLTLSEATAYLGIKALEQANLVELGIVHPHIGRDGTLYRVNELKKHRAISRCPQCKEHFAVTGRRKEACAGCDVFPAPDEVSAPPTIC